MRSVLRPLLVPRSYRELLFLLTGVALAPVWFTLLLGGWLIAALSALTPLVVPAVLALRMLTWFAARLEAILARELLEDDVRVPPPASVPRGYWSRMRTLADTGLWKQQAYLVLRVFAGSTLAIAVVTALATSFGLLGAPFYYRHADLQISTWHVDSLPRALALVPAGLVALVLSGWLVRACDVLWAPLPRLLLGGPPAEGAPGRPVALAFRRALPVHAAFLAGIAVLLAAIWALTTRAYFWPEWVLLPLALLLALHASVVLVDGRRSLSLGIRAVALHGGVAVALGTFLVTVWAVTRRGYFWPEWALLPFALTVGVHAWVVLVDARPSLVRAVRSRALAVHLGASSAIGAFLVVTWALTARGYFWPVWPILGLAVAALLHGMVDRTVLAERIDVLTATRAGAVDAAQEELSRIERDLHDGAQARLVALGMSLGMAEQKLAADPEAARRLLAEARLGAVEALKELRDLARGLQPPILTDRGLEAALSALAARSPLAVEVSVDVPARPDPTIETTAYFIAAEALANAVKHAHAGRVEIRIRHEAGQLEAEIRDDGVGGADAEGAGLSGLRRRVEALDGTLSISSPKGGRRSGPYCHASCDRRGPRAPAGRADAPAARQRDRRGCRRRGRRCPRRGGRARGA